MSDVSTRLDNNSADLPTGKEAIGVWKELCVLVQNNITWGEGKLDEECFIEYAIKNFNLSLKG
ncbi:MAG: hypothetical protein EOP48_26240 [Sphingobacteriales bacterium]|nr:MAG: hypothetical protein EOP48_26240 [Sphingobacteriales bacterium]